MNDPFQILFDLSSRFPIQLKILFSLRKIGDIKKFLNNNTLTQEELSRAAYSASLEGYQHELRNIEYWPRDLQENKEEVRRKLREDDVIENIPIISRIFDQRKIIITHLFYKDEFDWHVIYFTMNDIRKDEANHWKYGSHVHFVNCRWKGYKALEIWRMLEQRKYGSVGEHYRFREQKRSEP